MLSTDALSGEITVTPPIEIDAATGEIFARQIAQACALHPDRVVIDFQAVIFCDTTAVQVLLSALKGLEDRACVVVIRNPPWHLRRISQVLRLTGALGIPSQSEGP